MHDVALIALCTLATIVGCSKAGEGVIPSGDADPPVATSSTTNGGLELATNDAKIVGLAREALPCIAGAAPRAPCPALDAWSKSSITDVKAGAAPTLLAMLQDARDDVRYLAAIALRRSGPRPQDVTKPLLDAAARERSPFVAAELGAAATLFANDAEAHAGTLRKLAVDHPIAEMRRAVLATLDLRRAYLIEIPFEVARGDANILVRESAIQALSNAYTDKLPIAERVTTFLLELVDYADAKASATAVFYLATSPINAESTPATLAAWQTAVSKYEARLEAGKPVDALAPIAFGRIAKTAEASDLKPRIVALLRRMVEQPLPSCPTSARCEGVDAAKAARFGAESELKQLSAETKPEAK